MRRKRTLREPLTPVCVRLSINESICEQEESHTPYDGRQSLVLTHSTTYREVEFKENPSVRMLTEFLWSSTPLAHIHDDDYGMLMGHRSRSHWHSVSLRKAGD